MSGLNDSNKMTLGSNENTGNNPSGQHTPSAFDSNFSETENFHANQQSDDFSDEKLIDQPGSSFEKDPLNSSSIPPPSSFSNPPISAPSTLEMDDSTNNQSHLSSPPFSTNSGTGMGSIDQSLKNDLDSYNNSPPPPPPNVMSPPLSSIAPSSNSTMPPLPVRKPQAKKKRKPLDTTSTDFLDSLISQPKPEADDDSATSNVMPPPPMAAAFPDVGVSPPASSNTFPVIDAIDNLSNSIPPPTFSSPKTTTVFSQSTTLVSENASGLEFDQESTTFAVIESGPAIDNSADLQENNLESSQLEETENLASENEPFGSTSNPNESAGFFEKENISQSSFSNDNPLNSLGNSEVDINVCIPPAFDSAPSETEQNMESNTQPENANNPPSSSLFGTTSSAPDFFDNLQSEELESESKSVNEAPDFPPNHAELPPLPSSSDVFAAISSVKPPGHGHTDTSTETKGIHPVEKSIGSPEKEGTKPKEELFGSNSNGNDFLDSLAKNVSSEPNDGKQSFQVEPTPFRNSNESSSLFGNSDTSFLDEIGSNNQQGAQVPADPTSGNQVQPGPESSGLGSPFDDTPSTENDFFATVGQTSKPVKSPFDTADNTQPLNTNTETTSSSLFDELAASHNKTTSSSESDKPSTSAVNTAQTGPQQPLNESTTDSSSFSASEKSGDNFFKEMAKKPTNNIDGEPSQPVNSSAPATSAPKSDPFSAPENKNSPFGESNDDLFMSAINSSAKEDPFLAAIGNNNPAASQQKATAVSASVPNSDPFGNSEVEDEFSKLLERDLAEQNAAKSGGDLSASFAFLGDDDDLLPDDFIEPVNNREASQLQRPKTVGPTSANSYAPTQPTNHYSSPATYQQPPRSQSAMKQFNTANNSFDLPAAMMPKVKNMNSFTTQPVMGNTIVGNFKPNSQPQSPKASTKKASFFEELPIAPSRIISRKQSAATSFSAQVGPQTASHPSFPPTQEAFGRPQITSPPINQYAPLAANSQGTTGLPNQYQQQQQPGYPYMPSSTPQPNNQYAPSNQNASSNQYAPPSQQAPPSQYAPNQQQAPPNQYAPSQQQAPPSQYAPNQQQTFPNQYAPNQQQAPPNQYAPNQQQAPPSQYAPNQQQAPPNQYAPNQQQAPPNQYAPNQQQAPPSQYAPSQANNLYGPSHRNSFSNNSNSFGAPPLSPDSARRANSAYAPQAQQFDPYHRSSVTSPPQYPLSSIQPHQGQQPPSSHRLSFSGDYNQHLPQASSPLSQSVSLQPSASITQNRAPSGPSYKLPNSAYGDMPADIGARSAEASRSPQAQQAILHAKQMRSPSASTFPHNQHNAPTMMSPSLTTTNAPLAQYNNSGSQYGPPPSSYSRQNSFGPPHQAPQQQQQQPPAPRVNPETLLRRQFPLFCWGTGTKAVVGIPSVMSFGTSGSISELKLIDVTHALNPESTTQFPASIMSAKGPNKNKKKELEKWIEEHVKDLDARISKMVPSESVRYSDRSILWKVLLILLRGNNTPAKLGHEFVMEICKLLDPTTMQTKKEENTGFSPANLDIYKQTHRHRQTGSIDHTSRSLKTDDINGIIAFLKSGDREHALKYALDHGLWAHALILASSIGAEKWTETVAEFVREDIRPFPTQSARSLAYMFRLFSGSKSDSISEILPNNMAVTYKLPDPSPEVNAALRDWKSIGSLSFANYSPVCNDAIETLSSLLLNSGYVEASHTLNILFNPSMFGPGIIPGKNMAGPTSFLILGSQNGRDIEAILLSMAYEFYRCSTDSPAPLPFAHLLPYKLNYAAYLADYGKISDARSLYENITGFVKSAPKNPMITQSLLRQIDSLGHRLNVMPEDVGSGWFSSKLARPKLDQVLGQLDKSLTKFIAGEEVSNVEKKKQDGGIFKKLAETPSASCVDIRSKYGPITSSNSDMDLPPTVVPSRTQSTIGFHVDNKAMPPPPRSGSVAAFSLDYNRPASPYYSGSDGGFRPGSTGPSRSRRSSVNTRSSTTPDRVLSPTQPSSSDSKSSGIYGIPENGPLGVMTSPGRNKPPVSAQMSPPKAPKSGSAVNPYSPGTLANKYGSAANLRKNIYNPYAPKDAADGPGTVSKTPSLASNSPPYAPVSSDAEAPKRNPASGFSPRNSVVLPPHGGHGTVGSVGSLPSLPSSPLPSAASIARTMAATPENLSSNKLPVMSPNSSAQYGPPSLSPSSSAHLSRVTSPSNPYGPYEHTPSNSYSSPSKQSNPYAPVANTSVPSPELAASSLASASRVQSHNSYAPSKSSPVGREVADMFSTNLDAQVEHAFKRDSKVMDSLAEPERDDVEDEEDQSVASPPPPPPPASAPTKSKPSSAPKNPYAPGGTTQPQKPATNPYAPTSLSSASKPKTSAYNPYAPTSPSKPSKPAKSSNPYAPVHSSEKAEEKPENKRYSTSSESAAVPAYGGYNPYGPYGSYGYDDTPTESNKEPEDSQDDSNGISLKQGDSGDHEGASHQKEGDEEESDNDSYAPYEPPQYGFVSYGEGDEDLGNELAPPPPLGQSIYGGSGGTPLSEASGSTSSLYVPMGAPSFTSSTTYSKAVPLAHASTSNLGTYPDKEPEQEAEEPKKKEVTKKDYTPANPQPSSINNESEDEEYDEADDFLGGGPSKKKSKTPKTETKKGDKKGGNADDGEKKGWFGWLSRKEDGPKPIKAKLGEENSFYYDPELKRWINKKAPKEDQLKSASLPPPPPGGRMTPGLSSKPGTPAPMTMTSPTATPQPPGPSRTPAPFKPGTPGPGGMPSLSKPGTPGPGGMPPISKPGTPVPMSFTGGIDDLLAVAPSPGPRKKRNARNRYVDVMNSGT